MKAPPKIRADQLLVNQGLAPTRTKAQSLIMAGCIYWNTQKINKPSEQLPAQAQLIQKGVDHPYVSRGGVKLKAALDHFHISVDKKVCLDIGASTGGFTDCLLKEGASQVLALDVGYGQMHWSLQQNPAVILMDRTNFRTLDLQKITLSPQIITIDVSFISLTLLIPRIKELLIQKNLPEAHLVFLIKPQFEVGPEFIGKKGVVTNQTAIQTCLQKIQDCAQVHHLSPQGIIPSPIKGHEGNQEFLLFCLYVA